MNDNVLPRRACLAAILIGLLPAWMILLPLDMTSNPEGWQVFVRANSFAVPLAQLTFVLTAMSLTFSPFDALKKLPHITKAAVLLWVLVAGFVSFQAGKDHLSATIGIFKFGIAGLFLLALIELRNTFGARFLLILWVALGIGSVIYVALWTIHIFMNSPEASEWVTRIPGVNNVRHTGHFAIAGVTAGLFTFIAFGRSGNFWLRWFLPLLFSSVGLGLALWTGSRGPLLASLATILATFLFAVHHRKMVAGFVVASLISATAVVALLPVPHEIYGIANATGLSDVTVEGEHDASSGRTVLWADTLQKIAERPMLGWGVNQYGALGPSKPAKFLHPHNFPLQFLFSGGVISVLLMLVVIFSSLRQRRWPYTQGPAAAALAGVIGLLVYSLYDGVLYFSYPTLLFLVAVVSSTKPPLTRPVHDMSG